MNHHQQQQLHTHTDLDWLWAVVGILVALVALYFFAPAAFYGPWLALKSLQLELIRIFPVTDAEQSTLQQTRDWLASVPADNVTFKDISIVSSYVGEAMKIPAIALLCILGFVIAYRPAFRKRHSFESLIKQESQVWPHLRLMLKQHPEKESDPEKGPWAMRAKPADWSASQHIITEGVFDDARAASAFSNQLGETFNGVEILAAEQRHLFAVFASRISGDAQGCQQLLDELNLFYAGEQSDKKIDRLVNAAIEQYASHTDVQAILNRHAYTVTVLVAMYEAAKAIGILPSSFFLWLKLQNRTLWYTMNDVGRHVASTEAAGPRAHYLAEKAAGQPLSEPAIHYAVTALRESLADEGLMST